MPDSTSDPMVLFAAMQAWRTTRPQATLAEIEAEASRQVAGLRRDLMAAVLAPEVDLPTVCPTCGGALVRNGTTTRSVVIQQGVPLPITSQRLRCSACGAEVSPPA
jgi:hypothetical protein